MNEARERVDGALGRRPLYTLRRLASSETIRDAVKGRLRPFEYLGWAQSVPRSARYDLTRSGVADVADDDDPSAVTPWSSPLDLRSLCRRADRAIHVEALRTRVAARYGLDPELVTLTFGASQAINHALFSLVRPGDHVVVERPTYEALHRVPDLLGMSVSRLERTADEAWALVPERLAQLLTPRTRAVILSNLHNPSGVAFDAERLAMIAEMAARVGAIVLVDEVYLDFGFDLGGPFRPACLVATNTVSWSSTTKAFGFGALRAGWMVTRDPELARTIRAATYYFEAEFPPAVAALADRALAEADVWAARAVHASSAGRAAVERWLQGEARVEWVPPSAGQTCLVRLPELMDDLAFAAHLRERHDTQVVPGAFFEAKGFVRLSFGVPPDQLETALANFSVALDELGARR